ncbi:Hcp family type VI secretion system effector [Pseudocitrobacter faecalis]|uniref:Hcp family type VI secretion system effector n=1 Tax=Pseudocitrobacter faecalis TaxID=1398493 RepID=UPI00331479FE
MANIVYLTLKGETQGLISAGCSSLQSVGNKAQVSHRDQILVYALSHSISRVQNVNHHEVIIVKPLDKSSPLLGKAISENETLECEFDIYRTSPEGRNERCYQIKLSKAHIANIDFVIPHCILEPGGEMQEKIAFSYESINWEHNIAGTCAFSFWQDRIL